MWRQRMLEKACRPALANLGHQPLAARANPCGDDEETLQQHLPQQSTASVRLHACVHGQQPDEGPLQTGAWDMHCISSMLAGAPLCFSLLCCSACEGPSAEGCFSR